MVMKRKVADVRKALLCKGKVTVDAIMRTSEGAFVSTRCMGHNFDFMSRLHLDSILSKLHLDSKLSIH